MLSYEENEETPIQKFFSGTHVFVTGATGFLGHILIEKLLRSCPSVSKIYILVRSKKGKDLNTRVEEIFNDVLFDRLRNECPRFREKVIPVAGDCALPNLGLELNVIDMLIENVHIVFHAAATVRFNEPLKKAVHLNVRPVNDLIKISRKMKNLKSFIQVSTAYSNCNRDTVEEKIYKPPINANTLLEIVDSLSDSMLEKMEPIIVGDWQNTYALTKCVSEDLAHSEAINNNLPVGIFRPAQVIGSYKEPIPGWINNIYGVTGVLLGTGLGVVRVVYADPKLKICLVPVDMCVNSMITAAWEVHEEYNKSKKENIPFHVPIYNYVSATDQPITMNQIVKYGGAMHPLFPSTKAIWALSAGPVKNFVLYKIGVALLHFLPGYIMDGVLYCLGKKPMFVKLYTKVAEIEKVTNFFKLKEWHWESSGMHRLVNRMTPKDRKIFFSDIKQLDWLEFFNSYCRGIRLFVLKEPNDNLLEARARNQKLIYAHQALKTLLWFLLFYFIWTCFNFIF